MRNAETCTRDHEVRNVDASIRNTFLLSSIALSVILWGASAFAEIKVIEAESTYVMGDNDSKVDARRIALQEAKRKALELAGTYVESLTQVQEYRLTKDEVKAYTAGVIETEITADEMRGTVQHPEIYVKTICKIDIDTLKASIARYRENEDLKEQLQATAEEKENLKKERDSLIKQLSFEKNKAKAEKTRNRLSEVLSKEETNEETGKILSGLGSQLMAAEESELVINQAVLDESAAVLERVINVNPHNQRARYLLAAIYQKKGNQAGAENQLRAAIQRNPSNPLPHRKLGALLKEKGQYKAALNEFHFVERIRPRDPLMLFYTGMIFKETNRCGRAVQYLERFLKNPRTDRFPNKKEAAVQAIRECGGARGGYQKRIRYNK